MALANPLSIAAFYDLFNVDEVQFVQKFNQQSSLTGGSDMRYADRADSQWRAEIRTLEMNDADAEGIMVLINSRGGGLKTALMYNSKLPYPPDDPDGSIIGATAPKIATITDRLHISFSGFPASYALRRGTYFGCVFDTSRYYLGQLAETATANGSGAVSTVEIWPPLPASIVTDTVVSVSKPPAKFKITPNSAYPEQQDVLYSTIKFSAEQTYGR